MQLSYAVKEEWGPGGVGVAAGWGVADPKWVRFASCKSGQLVA